MKATKKEMEEHRRQILRAAPHRVPVSAHDPDPDVRAVYRQIVDSIWMAWDRTGHAGSPDGAVPTAFCVTPQQGTGNMLWYIGHDGWRDCSWRQPAGRSAHELLRDACREAVNVDVEMFAARRNRDRFREDVDHYRPLFVELISAWVESLPEPDRGPEMYAAISSRPAVSFDRMLQIAASGRNTGQSSWQRPAGDRWRNSWRSYHAEHAVLQIVLRKDNARKGGRHVEIPGRGRGRVHDDPRDAHGFFGPDLPDLDL